MKNLKKCAVFMSAFLLCSFTIIAQVSLAPLPYDYAALEPFIDKTTMEIHHDKHHQAYITNLNKALTEAKLTNPNLDELVTQVSKYSSFLRNNLGGHLNHSLFWQLLCPATESKLEGKLIAEIEKEWKTMDAFKTAFSKEALARFGSGWVWLIRTKEGKLVITSTANQDSPLMDVAEVKGTPLLALDLWEHAYYLKYQNKRADYVAGWWNIVNWKFADQLFQNALKK